VAWLPGRPGVTSLVIGARTEAQLADNLAAADLVLEADERAALDKASSPSSSILVASEQHGSGPAQRR
jgi:aryl-alcohol dehydrogenase-like predicted oxidoreductase